MKAGSVLLPLHWLAQLAITGLLPALGAEDVRAARDLCVFSMESATPVMSAEYIIPGLPAVAVKTAVLSPLLLSLLTLPDLVLVPSSLVLSWYVHHLWPEHVLAPSILAWA